MEPRISNPDETQGREHSFEASVERGRACSDPKLPEPFTNTTSTNSRTVRRSLGPDSKIAALTGQAFARAWLVEEECRSLEMQDRVDQDAELLYRSSLL